MYSVISITAVTDVHPDFLAPLEPQQAPEPGGQWEAFVETTHAKLFQQDPGIMIRGPLSIAQARVHLIK